MFGGPFLRDFVAPLFSLLFPPFLQGGVAQLCLFLVLCCPLPLPALGEVTLNGCVLGLLFLLGACFQLFFDMKHQLNSL